MLVYKLVWEDRNGSTTEWLGTKKDLAVRKSYVQKMGPKRPYDQIEVSFSGQIDIPTNKEELLHWLNRFVL